MDTSIEALSKTKPALENTTTKIELPTAYLI